MPKIFKHLDDQGRFPAHLLRRNPEAELGAVKWDSKEQELLYDIDSLADSAVLFFRGIYSIESPYFACGRLLELPWHADYEPDCGDGTQKPIDAELEDIVSTISEARCMAGEQYHRLTYLLKELSSTAKMKVQSLAVEMLLTIDSLLDDLEKQSFVSALCQLSEVYKYVSELTVTAQDILVESSSDASKLLSKLGTDARHKDMRRLQEWVVTECRARTFPSMHKASFTLADQAVAKAREFGTRLSPERAQKTVYDWLRSAAREGK